MLFVGDLAIFLLSLWSALSLRNLSLADWSVFETHLVPFSILFVIWIVVFFSAGLYEKQTLIFKDKLPLRLLKTQIFNIVLAVVFFYFMPYSGLTPKTILFVYLAVSLLLIFMWRSLAPRLLSLRSRDKAVLIGSGPEVDKLFNEVNGNNRYSFRFVKSLTPAEAQAFDFNDINLVVVDLQGEVSQDLSKFYQLLLARTQLIDLSSFYAEVFDCVPVSLLSHRWFIDNIFLSKNSAYDFLKRIADVVFAVLFGLISFIFYPIVIFLIKLDDRGDIFITQDRVGQNNKLIKIKKFRTMAFNDNESIGTEKNRLTRVGPFLRNTRLDELPQLWNILRGDLSLIGPRPELPTLVAVYQKELPYYNVRHLIKPGLSGWAQIYHEGHPHRGANVEATREKLSYDLYYVKNRSILLDLKITLKTFKTLISRTGR